MKRYLYILLIAALASACAREEVAPETIGPEESIPEGLTVPVIMHFDQPLTLYAETKATAGMEWGVDPRISSIHVAVFGWGGYLQDYLTAEPCDASGNPVSGYATANSEATGPVTNYFLVRLPVNTDGRRTCHIIANGPDNVEFAYDTDLMKTLSTKDGNGGYWQWVYLADGILPERDGDGEFVTDAVTGELKPSAAVINAFSNISLIRNFASVTVEVSDACENFQIQGWTICKMPVEGTFAPYSSAWETNNVIDGRGYGWLGNYATEWAYNTATAKVYRTLPDITYEGFPTEPKIEAKVPQNPSAFNAAGVAVAPGATKFVYERSVTSESNPFLLIAAKYVAEVQDPAPDYYTSQMTSAPVYYYRMDISKDGEYVPFYRNYSYKITISGASVEGYNSPAIAAKHNSSDSFSLSLDTATLSDVSDGLTRLTTDKAAFSYTYDSGDATKSFGYDFVKLSPEEHLNSNANVTVTVTGNAIKSSPALTWGASGSKGVITYTLEEPDGDEILTSTIKIMGVIKDGSSNVISRLVRNVTVVVFNKMHVNPKFVPAIVAPQKGEETELIIPLYKDLPWTMFPMQIKIEDTNKTLNPSEGTNLPVQVGPFKAGEKSTFYYVYTLNYSDYESLNEDAKASGKAEVEVSMPMTTILDANATTARIGNDYFDGVPTATLQNDTDNIITPNTATIDAATTTKTFTVKSTGNWVITISREHGAAAPRASVTPSSGVITDGTTVTVNVPENTALVERKYILTLTNLDKTEDKTRTAELTHSGAAPKLELSGTNSIKGNDLSTSITVNVASNCEWEVDFAAGSEYAEFDTDTFGSGNGSVAIHMNAANYGTNAATGRPVTLRFTNKYNGITTDYTITQRGLYTSGNVNSNSLTGTGLTLTASESATGRSITFSGGGSSKHYSAWGISAHYYVDSGTFTASGSGDDFCTFKQLVINYYDGKLNNWDANCTRVTAPHLNIGTVSNSDHSSTWNMPSPISDDNIVNSVVLTPTAQSSEFHAISLTATYYYWN